MSEHPRWQRRLVAAGFVWFALMGIAVTANGPLSVVLAEAFGQPKASEPQVGTAFFIGSALAIALSAAFSSLFSGSWVARACGASYTIGAGLCALTQSWMGLLLGLAMMGAGNGGLSIWFNAEFARTFEGPKRNAWLTALNGCWAVGAVMGPALVNLFGSAPKGPHTAIAVVALLSLPLALAVPAHRARKDSADTHIGRLPGRVWALAALLGLYVTAEVTTLLLMTRHLIEVHGFVVAGASLVGSGLWLAFMCGRFGASPLSMRLSPGMLIAGSALLAVAGLGLTLMSSTVWAGYLLLGLSMGPIFPAVIAWGTSLTTAAHRATSVMVLGPCVGALIGPEVFGRLLQDRWSQMPLWVAGMFLVIATLSFWWDRSSPAKS